ncbi:MAG: MerR family DNA-binding transcriptional regulator [Rickettsiales bacterium]|nr:MerR family DNA-binding transcriptional regulator [Rickettsiales bacterium]
MELLTIGKLAELTGMHVDTLRYYEKMELIRAETRSRAGYRLYEHYTIQLVHFINGAKALNFTLADIQKLLMLQSRDKTACAEVIKYIDEKIKYAESRIKEFKEIKNNLTKLVENCPGGEQYLNTYPVLDHLKAIKT